MIPQFLKERAAAEAVGCDVYQFRQFVKLGHIPRRGSGLSGGRYMDSEVAALKEKLAGMTVNPMHLYVVEFVDRCIKIGITGNPHKRLQRHYGDAKKFGMAVGRVWVSVRHVEAQRNELLLKRGQRTEYITGRTFDSVLRDVLALPVTRAEVSCG